MGAGLGMVSAGDDLGFDVVLNRFSTDKFDVRRVSTTGVSKARRLADFRCNVEPTASFEDIHRAEQAARSGNHYASLTSDCFIVPACHGMTEGAQ